MLYLAENEIAADANFIGFPSVCGCRAVVLVTDGGLIGWHLAGSDADHKMRKFGDYVDAQDHGAAQLTLYVASRGDDKECSQTAAAIRKATGFRGPAYYADLRPLGGRSAYVAFSGGVRGSGTCVIQGRAWDDSDAKDSDMDTTDPAGRVYAQGSKRPSFMVRFTEGKLKTLYPSKLS